MAQMSHLQFLKSNLLRLDDLKHKRRDNNPLSFNLRPLCNDTSCVAFRESLQREKREWDQATRYAIRSSASAAPKSDLDSSVSQWDWRCMERHASSLSTSARPGVQSTEGIDDDTLQRIKQGLADNAWTLLGHNVQKRDVASAPIEFLSQLQTTKLSKLMHQLFVDSLVLPLLVKNGYRVTLDERMIVPERHKVVPNTIADYMVCDPKGKILGAIAVKVPGEMNSKAAIQCILQVLSLRTKEKGVLFGILTDSIHYFCFYLDKDGVLVFEDQNTREHTLRTWGSVLDVAKVLDAYFNVRRNRRSVTC